MLICEVVQTNVADQLLPLVHLLKSRERPVPVGVLLKLAQHKGISLTKETLTDLIAAPPLANVISGFDPENGYLTFHSSDELEAPAEPDDGEDRVASMAHRQLKKS